MRDRSLLRHHEEVMMSKYDCVRRIYEKDPAPLSLDQGAVMSILEGTNNFTIPSSVKEELFPKVGDIFYVEEEWTTYQTINHIRRPDGRSFSEVSDGSYAYRADGFNTIEDLKDYIIMMSGPDLEAIEVEDWHHPKLMPRDAARIFLEVVDVNAWDGGFIRVEVI